MNTATVSRAESPLTTPTYDGSGQAVHPDIYDAGAGNTWNGHRYWMALTPYPASNEQKENPSILVSEDGNTWSVPNGLTNPIVPEPSAPAYNFDPDITVDGSTMYLVYGNQDGLDVTNEIYIRSSSNGVTWSDATLLFSVDHPRCLSPSIVKVGSTYYMYSIDANGHPSAGNYYVNRRSSSAIDSGWSAPSVVAFDMTPLSLKPWHIDVIYTEGVYMALLMTSEGYWFLAKSSDGLAFYRSPLLLSQSPSALWDKSLYRASIVRASGGFNMWYSASTGGGSPTWHVGRTTISIEYK